MGIQEGLLLADAVHNVGQESEMARLKAQLYKGQAEHQDAQAKLLHLDLTQRQQAMQNFQQMRAARLAQAPELADQLTTSPESATYGPSPYEQGGDFVGPPRALGPAPTSTPSPSPSPTPTPTRTPPDVRTSSDHLRPEDQDMLDWAQANLTAGRSLEGDHILTGVAAINKIRREAKEQQASESAGFFMKHLIGFSQAAESTGQTLDPKVEGWYRGLIYAALNDAGKTAEAQAFLASKDLTVPGMGVVFKRSPTGKLTAIAMNPNAPVTAITSGGGFGTLNVQPGRVLEPGQQPQAPAGQPAAPAPVQAPVQAPAPGASPPVTDELTQITRQLVEAGATPADAQRMGPIVLRAMTPVPAPGAPAASATPPPSAGPSVTVLRQPMSLEQVEAAKEITRRNIAVYGTPTPPPGKQNATAADEAAMQQQVRQNIEAGRPGATAGDVTQVRTGGTIAGTAEAQRLLPLAQLPPEQGHGWVDTTTGKPVKRTMQYGQMLDEIDAVPAGAMPPYTRLEGEAAKEYGQLSRHIPGFNKLAGLVQEIYGTVFKEYESRVAQGFKGAFSKYLQDSPAYTRYIRETGPLATSFKAYAGESGRLTDEDRRVLTAIFPQVGGALPDRPDVAQGLLQDVADVINGTAGQILGNPNFKFQTLKVPQLKGAKVTAGSADQGTTPAKSGQPKEETPEQQTERLRQKYAIPKRTP